VDDRAVEVLERPRFASLAVLGQPRFASLAGSGNGHSR
jgi:hypothetical protein